MTENIDIAIIGGGVIGCWLALELAGTADNIFVFERNPGIIQGENQSSRNSGVLHAGLNYDKETRPLKARLCVKGNSLWYEFCRDYGIPCRQTGKIVVAMNERELSILERYRRLAVENHVPDVRIISGADVSDLEPNVKADAALLVPTSGIIEPTRALHQLYALASNAGVQFMPQTEVVHLAPRTGGVRMRLRYRDGNQEEVDTRWAINAAGVHAVKLALTLDPAIPIRPSAIRGDSMKFYRTRRQGLHLNGMNVYPPPIVLETPGGPQFTVGVHLTPTFDIVDGEYVIGNTVTVGPKLSPVSHLEDYATPVPPPEVFAQDVQFFPDLRADDLELHQSGVQARLANYPDFFISKDRTCPNAIHLLGIDSPGLTAAPAIARYVRAIMVY